MSRLDGDIHLLHRALELGGPWVIFEVAAELLAVVDGFAEEPDGCRSFRASAPPRRKSRRGCEIREDEGESARGGGEIDGRVSSARAGSGGAGSRSRRRILSRRAIAPLDRAARSQRRPRGARRAPIGARQNPRGIRPSTPIVDREERDAANARGGTRWRRTWRRTSSRPIFRGRRASRPSPMVAARAPCARAAWRAKFAPISRRRKGRLKGPTRHHVCRVARRDRRTRDVRLTSRL